MLEKFTDGATRWVGSTTSIVLHTLLFGGVFGLLFAGVALDTILLVLTTVVSLEAIYLALFIQRSVNLNTATLEEAAEDIQGIEEDIEDISEDVEDIEGEIDDLQEHQEHEEQEESQVARLEREVAELKELLSTVAKALEGAGSQKSE